MASSRIVNSPYYLTAGSSAIPDTNLDDPDEESIRLAIALQLEDLENYVEPNVDEDDEEAVFEVYRSYLEESERFFQDRRLAEEIATWGDPVVVVMDDDESSEEERVGGKVQGKVWGKKGKEKGKVVDFEDVDEDVDEDADEDADAELRLACELSSQLFEEERRRNELPTASSYVPAPAPVPAAPPPTRTCSSCMENFPSPSLIVPPCRHPYCHPCLKQLFIHACEDQSAFPPHCCKLPLPLYLINRWLTRQELKLFREKVAEYTAEDRLYCSNRECSAFLPTTAKAGGGRIGIRAEAVTCRQCKHGTCVRCMAPEHAGDCPEDSELTATLTVAAREGWQRCQSCYALVEKDYGCQHMSCLCGSEWCYRCAAKWKSCACGDFELEGEAVPVRTVDDLIVKRAAIDEAERKRRSEERDELRKRQWDRCGHGGRLSEKLRGRAKAREKGHKGTRKGKERAGEEEGGGDTRESGSGSGKGAGGVEEEPLWGEEGLWKYKLGESKCDVCEVVLRDYIWACEGCGMEACMACRENGL